MPRRCKWTLFLVTGLLEAGHPPFRLFTTEDGLVRNWVTRIRRDSKGYLWLCTVEGLSLFDGYRFTNFTTQDGLPSRLVNDVLETRAGEYWIATRDGLSRLHPITGDGAGRFENFRVDSTEGANHVEALLEDSANNIWCATGAGLYRLRPSGKEVRAQLVPLDPGRAVSVNALLEDPRGRLWAASANGVYLRLRDGRLRHLPSVSGTAGAMLLDHRRRVWVAASGGLVGFSLDSDPPAVFAHYVEAQGKSLEVQALHAAANGDIWIGARGLIRFRPDAPPGGRFRIFAGAPALDNLYIFSLASDAQENLWIAVSTLGAAVISREPSELFSETDGLESRFVRGLTQGRRGTLFAVTGELILNEFKGTRFEPRPRRLPPGLNNSTWGQSQVALQDRAGHWWFASAGGVLRYPSTDDARTLAVTGPRVYTTRQGLPSDFVLRLFEDSRGDIWAGTANGVARWSRSSRRWTAYGALAAAPPDGAFPAVHAIVEDRSGAIWVGGVAPGLWRIAGSRFETVSEGVLLGFVNALLMDHRGRLWIGSSQGGLGRMDHPGAARPRIQTYTIQAGLSSNHVFSLAEDRWGRIYIAGGRGVDRLDPESSAIRHFTQANGLPGGETERLYRDRNGSIWFASNFGLARYDPEADRVASPPPPLLRSFRVDGVPHPISLLGERSLAGPELAPRQNHLEINYRALHFEPGELLRYQYRLSGASEQWSSPSDLQTVQYANLAPGRYRFEVRSVGGTGLVSAPATVQFRLLAPVWRRAWFLAMMAVLIAGAGYGLHRYRLSHVMAVERVRTRIATDLHDDIGSSLSQVAILSEVVRRRVGLDDPQVIRSHSEKIAAISRELVDSMSLIVWAINPKKDRLIDLTQRMRQFAGEMLAPRSIEFSFEAAHRGHDVSLDPDVRRQVFLIFKECIHNIVRHSRCTRACIQLLGIESGWLMLVVSDNGRGLDGVPGEGHGFASMRNRARSLGGSLDVVSAANQGVRITLRVPAARR